ncbi:MAG: ECF-type sigma factor [Panacagrimonas sp.]
MTTDASITADGVGGAQPIEALWEGFVAGDAVARDHLLARYYDEFRGVARRVLREDAGKLQLQTTDLAHDAAVRILKLDRIDWQGRTHFLALSARVMRQVLLDEVRRFRAAKRQAPPVETLWPTDSSDSSISLDVEALDGALTRLASVDEGRARVVELRFFAGLSIEEIAAEQGASPSTIKRQWRSARAWLLTELAPASA